MTEPGQLDGAFGLADFLADLREHLALAQQRAAGSSLRLGVEEVTVALEVAVTSERRRGGSGKLSAKFWVMNAELGGTGERSSQRVGTQMLTLTLKPRVDEVVYDAQGQVEVAGHRGRARDRCRSPRQPAG